MGERSATWRDVNKDFRFGFFSREFCREFKERRHARGHVFCTIKEILHTTRRISRQFSNDV